MILHNIKENMYKMSKNHKKIAEYILGNYKQAAFMKSTELAHEAGVSNATVTRFCVALGYEGFAALQEDLQTTVLNRISTIDQISYMENSANDYYITNMLHSIQDIPAIYDERDRETINRAAELIEESAYVYFAGAQMSEVFVSFAVYTLSKFKTGVSDISNWNLDAEDHVSSHAKEACAVVFVMQRYPAKTMEILKTLHEKGVPIILFTDSPLFPYLDMAKYVIYIPTRYISFINPIAIGLCTIHEIIVRVAHLNLEAAKANVERWEAFVERNGVYALEHKKNSMPEAMFYNEYLK